MLVLADERQNSFNCVSLLVCFHAFWMCFPFVVCSCVFSICVHVWCFFLWLVQFPFCDVYLCRWHVLSILVLREIPTCKKTNENERQNSFNCVSLLVCFHAFWMCFRFVVCSCVFSICVHAWCFFSVIIMRVQFPFCDVYLRRWHVLSILVWREIPTCKKTNENERQNSFNCDSLLVCFHAFWMCFPFVVCSCAFSICVHVWCFFLWLSCVSNFLLRRLFVQMTCALDLGFARNPHMQENQWKWKTKFFQLCFPFGVFSCLLDVFSLCCVFMCLFDMCSRVVFFSVIIMCVQFPFCDVYLCRWHVLSILVLREIPTCKKTNENERQNSFNCVSLLVCFHAFWMCFPFVVCSCVFSICVHVWRFFCDYHVCPISFLRHLFVQMTCALDLGFARNPHMQENQWKWKTKFFQLCFPFGVFSCLLDVFSLCCVFMCLFDMCSRVVFFFLWLSCVSNFLFATSICADDMCSRSWFCAKSPHVRKPMKMKDKILSIAFPFWCVFMPFGCVFPLLCVHVSFRYVFTCGVFSVIIMCVQFPFCDVYLCRWHVLSILVLREIPTCKKTNENERQNSFNCVSLLVCFHAFWMCFPFVVCSCVFSICVHVWCFFCDYHVCPTSFLRRLFVQMTCALDLGFARNPHM